MKIEVRINKDCKEPKVIVETNELNDEVNALIKQLSESHYRMIAGSKGDTVDLLEPDDIYNVYATGGKVLAMTTHGEYVLRLHLYEVEQRLNGRSFVRISNSEIINLRRVKGFDLSFAGTICVKLTNGTVTYVSRRNVAKIKKLLGI